MFLHCSNIHVNMPILTPSFGPEDLLVYDGEGNVVLEVGHRVTQERAKEQGCHTTSSTAVNTKSIAADTTSAATAAVHTVYTVRNVRRAHTSAPRANSR